METIRVYRKRDVLAWVPMKVRVHTGGYERLTVGQPAELKTRKGAPYTFQVRFLGMKKEVEVQPKPAKNRDFELHVGSEGQGGFGLLMGMLVGIFLFVTGLRAPEPITELMVGGLLLLPLMLTFLLGQIRIVPRSSAD